jgi:heptaprenylglyceryl phosphate synthase
MKMNRIAYAALVVAVLTTGAYSQSERDSEKSYFSRAPITDLVKIDTLYASALRSENIGVIESALAHVAMMRLMNPAEEFYKAKVQVELIASTNPSQEVRYKAYLVGTVIKNPGLFAEAKEAEYASPDELFAVLAARMQRLVVGTL